MTLLQLRYFCAVCDGGTISRAAEAMGVSQPAVSSAIRELEKEFGCALLRRSNNRVSLTHNGEVLRRRAASLLEEADHISDGMRTIANAGLFLRIGVPPVISAHMIPVFAALSEEIRAYTPSVEVKLISVQVDQMIAEISSGKLDLLISNLTTADFFGCEHLILTSIPIHAYVGKNHPLADLKTLSIHQLQREPIASVHGTSIHVLVTEWYRRYGYEPNFRYSYKQIQTAADMLLMNDCVTLSSVVLHKNRTDIICIPLEEPLYTEVGIFWPSGRTPSAETFRFIHFLQGLFAERDDYTSQ